MPRWDGVYGFTTFTCLVRDSLNDEAIDSNIDINCVEMILKHVLDEHEGATEAVNTLHQEVAERMSAERHV